MARRGSRRGMNRRRKLKKKDKLNIVLVLLMLVGCISLVMLLISLWENRQYKPEDAGGEGNVYIEPVIKEAKKVTYEGKTYTQKKHVESYLLLGVDNHGNLSEFSGVYGPQADVQIVLVIDNDNKTWRLLQLNRDSMVNVRVMNEMGDFLGYTYEQLAFAHAQGDGSIMSAKNNMLTVSELLWEQPINGVAAINMDSIGILTDAVGGVTVNITQDFVDLNDNFKVGQDVTLNGEMALQFIRTRSHTDIEANLARMARQREFMKSFIKQFAKLDENAILETYGEIVKYMNTDIGSGVMLALAEKIKDYTELSLMTIDGESEIKDVYVEYTLDKDSLDHTILELFYE